MSDNLSFAYNKKRVIIKAVEFAEHGNRSLPGYEFGFVTSDLVVVEKTGCWVKFLDIDCSGLTALIYSMVAKEEAMAKVQLGDMVVKVMLSNSIWRSGEKSLLDMLTTFSGLVNTGFDKLGNIFKNELQELINEQPEENKEPEDEPYIVRQIACDTSDMRPLVVIDKNVSKVSLSVLCNMFKRKLHYEIPANEDYSLIGTWVKNAHEIATYQEAVGRKPMYTSGGVAVYLINNVYFVLDETSENAVSGVEPNTFSAYKIVSNVDNECVGYVVYSDSVASSVDNMSIEDFIIQIAKGTNIRFNTETHKFDALYRLEEPDRNDVLQNAASDDYLVCVMDKDSNILDSSIKNDVVKPDYKLFKVEYTHKSEGHDRAARWVVVDMSLVKVDSEETLLGFIAEECIRVNQYTIRNNRVERRFKVVPCDDSVSNDLRKLMANAVIGCFSDNKEVIKKVFKHHLER